ncbi:MAG: hypothetical protein NZT61_01390, partial [Deltaproteobacteria bacterium]|nr:hypothetical protein [Deltaproteobacteria bacterium]
LGVETQALEQALEKIKSSDVAEEMTKLITSQIVTSVATRLGVDRSYAEAMLGVVVSALDVAYEASKVMFPPDVQDIDRYQQNPYLKADFAAYELEIKMLLGSKYF